MVNRQDTLGVPEDMKRTTGRDAHRSNIAVIHALAQTVRSTLGPKGMDKMIVDGLGDIVVTNDGFTLLNEMRVRHPAAKLAIEAAVTQQDKVGDGTTTVIVLAGELLRKAEDLLEMDVHPAVIARGFRTAERMAQEILEDLGEAVDFDDDEIIKRIAHTAMTGKGAESAKETLASLAIQAVRKVIRHDGERAVIDGDGVKLERIVGEATEASALMEGVLLARERAHPSMPTRVEDANVGLIDQPIEIKDPEIATQIHISDPRQMQAFVEQERQNLAEMVERIVASGCNVLFCQQNIEEPADDFLSQAGVFAVRRVPHGDLVRLAKATGARIVSSPHMLDAAHLGRAGRVREETLGKSTFIYVEDCEDPKAVTLLVKGSTAHAAEEARRALEDAVGDIGSALTRGKVVAGAGAVEAELTWCLRQRARAELTGKERLVAEAFADAMTVVLRTLIESSGADAIDQLSLVEARHERHDTWCGFDVVSGQLVDAWQAGILEPLEIKTQAVASATEVAVMILRIDDILIGDAPADAERGG